MNGKRMALTGAGIVAAAGIAIGAASLASADGGTVTNGYAGAGYGVEAPGGAHDGAGGASGTGSGRGGRGGGSDPSKPVRADEQLLTGDVAAQVTAAAKAKEPTATVERVETDSDGVYEAHMVRTDGTHVVVQVDRSYAVTGVQVMGQGGPGGPGSGGSGGSNGEGSGGGTTPALPSPSSTA